MSSPQEATLTADAPRTRAVAESSEFLLLADEKISEEDRKEILESIEKVAAENRIHAGESVFKITPLKRGFIFPLIINLLAVAAVGGGFVASSVYFSRKQAAISSQAGTFFSAEGKIIEQVRKQSAAKLKAKDEEIATVKAKLAKLDKESTALRSSMQATIQARELQLKDQMQSQLVAEKARLQKLGISQTEIASRLATFEKQKNAQFAQQLDQYKRQNEAALKEKERQIQAQQQQTQKALAQANQERQQLITAAQQQEAQLRRQYEAQTASLKSANQQLKARSTAAEQKLQALSLQSQSEQLVTDQIIGSYNIILQDIQQAHYNQAKNDITSLKTLLNSPSVDAVPALAQRRPVDLELLTSLGELIAARSQPGQPTTDPTFVRRANEVAAATKLVDQADSAQKGGDTTGALDLYAKAIAQVPVIQKAYAALTAAFDRNRNDAISQREKTIAQVRQESARKTAQIGQLTKQLGDTQTSLASAQTTIDELKKQVADQTARIADLAGQTTGQKQTADELQKQVADQNRQLADLKRKLGQANASLAGLTQKLTARDTETASLQKQLAAERSTAQTYQSKLAEQTAAAASRENQLSSSKVTVASLQKQLADSAARISSLQTELSTAQSKISGLQTEASNYANTVTSIQGDYADYHTRLTQLISAGTPQDIQKARELLLQFIDRSGIDSVLPGFSGVTNTITTAAAQTATRSLSTGSGQSSLTANGYRLIGTISYISSDSVTVEKLVNVPVSRGANVLIRHKSSDGNEVAIADGTVTGLTSDSVQVTIKSLLHGTTSPQLLDVVYVQPSAGT